MKRIVVCLFVFLYLNNLCYSISYPDRGDFWKEVTVYSKLSSLTNPTKQDWKILQHYLTHGQRSHLKLLKDYEPNMRRFCLYGNSATEKPTRGIEHVNCDSDYLESCLIVYSSFNKNYPRGLKKLVEHVKNSDFKGHILWMLGGWPDLEGGSLKLAHIPYAFKVAFFNEARRKGYKKVFWLDTSLLPVGSINKIFDIIQTKGYFAVQNSHMIGPWMNEVSANAFNLSLNETQDIVSCCGGIFGVDFSTKIGNDIIDAWYQAAENKIAFFSPRSDQNVLSILLHFAGMNDLIPLSRVAHKKQEITEDTLLLIEREFVNEISLDQGQKR